MCFNKAWTLSLRRTGLDRFISFSLKIFIRETEIYLMSWLTKYFGVRYSPVERLIISFQG